MLSGTPFEIDIGLGLSALVTLMFSVYVIYGLITSITTAVSRHRRRRPKKSSSISSLASHPHQLLDPLQGAAAAPLLSQASSAVGFRFVKSYVPYLKDEDYALDNFDIVPRINEVMSLNGLGDVAELLDRLLVVDCNHPSSLVLTHHRNAPRCPQHLKGDSSGDTVFNAVHARHPALTLPLVTANHFDIDALVSVFVAAATDISSPDLAQEFAVRHEVLLRQVSKVGDFRELAPENPTSVEATKVCCWLNSVEKREFYRPFDGDESEGAPLKFDYFLPRFPRVLENVAAFEAEWRSEFDQVMAGVRQLQEAAVIQKYPELGLVIISTTEPVHYYSLFSVTHGYDVVLAMYQGGRYELEYKYTGYVDIVSRPVLPRVDPTKLLEKLNDLEEPVQPDLYWNGNRITDSGPIIRLDRKGIKLNKVERYGNPTERPIYASSLPPADMASIVKSYFGYAYKDVRAVTPWTWSEIHKFNRSIDWEAWPGMSA